MTRTYLVGEAAVTAAAVAGREPAAALAAICDVARGFDAVLALTDEELAALFPLVLGRQAASAVEHRPAGRPRPRQRLRDGADRHRLGDPGNGGRHPAGAREAAVRAACRRDPHPRGRRVTELLRGASPPVDGRPPPGWSTWARPATGSLTASGGRRRGSRQCFRAGSAWAAGARAGRRMARGPACGSRPRCTWAPTCSARPARPCPRRLAARSSARATVSWCSATSSMTGRSGSGSPPSIPRSSRALSCSPASRSAPWPRPPRCRRTRMCSCARRRSSDCRARRRARWRTPG